MKVGFQTRAETLTIPSLSPPHHPQESLRLQEQAALEAEDGEGLQQTLRDLAQVGGGREPRGREGPGREGPPRPLVALR